MSQSIPISFYATPPHECSYLSERMATTVFADPRAQMDMHIYSALIQYGYRRSGSHVYAPHCEGCSSCRSMRLVIEDFQSNRSQRRNLQQNRSLSTHIHSADFSQEHYDLYEKYIASRHQGGGMDNPQPDSYMDFLSADWCQTQFVEFREAGQLLAVAVVDQMDNGLSAVYTFFDPEYSSRGLGTYAVLWQIDEARRRQLPYLYLGYWIEESPKMAYKAHFQPHQIFSGGQWQ